MRYKRDEVVVSCLFLDMIPNKFPKILLCHENDKNMSKKVMMIINIYQASL